MRKKFGSYWYEPSKATHAEVAGLSDEGKPGYKYIPVLDGKPVQFAISCNVEERRCLVHKTTEDGTAIAEPEKDATIKECIHGDFELWYISENQSDDPNSD